MILRSKIIKAIGFLFGEEEQFSLENRLFLTSVIIGILISINGAIISSFFSASFVTGVICILLAILLLGLYYFIRFKRIVEPFKIPIIIISFTGISIIWVFDGGSNGSDLMVGFVILILALIGVSARNKKYVFLLFIVLTVIIYFIQFYRPDLIVHMPSVKNRVIDSFITTIYCSVFIFLIIRFLHNNYTKERQKAEENGERFKAIFENSKDAIGIFKNGHHILFNRAYMNLFGYEDKSEIIGKSIIELIAPQERSKITIYIQTALSNKEESNLLESIGIRKNGNRFPFEIQIGTYDLNHEKFATAILRDISKRKKSEEALRLSEEKF